MNLDAAMKAVDDATTNLGNTVNVMSDATTKVAKKMTDQAATISTSMTDEAVKSAQAALMNEASKLTEVSAGLSTVAQTLIDLSVSNVVPPA